MTRKIYPSVYCKIKIRFRKKTIKVYFLKVKSKNERSMRSYFVHSHFFWVVQTNTNVKRNLWSRMKTTILLYPQNHVEFSQQIGDKFHDFRRVVYIDGPLWHHEYTKSRAISKKVNNKFTSCTSFHLYLFKKKTAIFS